MGTLAALAAELASPLVLWVLNTMVFKIPAAFMVWLIHHEMVSLEAGPCGAA